MILLSNVELISMETEQVESNMDILIKEDKIVKISKVIESENAERIDCQGYYLMPALFDSHVHMNSTEMAKLFIANGITGVRHMSGGEHIQDYIQKIESGEVLGPKVFSTSAIYDGDRALDKKETYQYIGSISEAESAVMDTIKNGFAWVKTYPSIDPEHLEHLMRVAAQQQIKVCGHMSYYVNSKILCDWGYECCEHSSSLPADEDEIRYLAEMGMWLCPTQVVCETLPDYVWNNKKLKDLSKVEFVPAEIMVFWEEKNAEIINGYKRREVKPNIQTVINKGKVFMKYSDRVIAGTDTMYPGIVAGFSLHDELEKMVTLYERTPYEALKMATVNPAKYLGLSNQIGKVEVGYQADLILLRKNPLLDITHSRSIETVIKAGKVYDRQALDEMLNEVKTTPAQFIEKIF